MRRHIYISIMLVSSLVAQPAAASSTDTTVFKSNDWQVRLVHWDDGTSACVAEVTYARDAFSIWEDKTKPIRLQLFSGGWQFGDKDSYVDLVAQVDDHQPWNLHHADRYKNSILFDIPRGDVGGQFLSDIASGSVLHVKDDSGAEMEDWSLAGAQPSINALSDCVSKLP